jgi:hypothetical protein
MHYKEQGLKTPFFDTVMNLLEKVLKNILYLLIPISFVIFLYLFEAKENFKIFFFITSIVGYYTILFFIYKFYKNE